METEQIVEMWESSQRKLIPFDARVHGSIEDDAPNTSQVDFANKMIGGGVLGRGCVQEEIRFLVNADCIISRLFSQELEDNECILIRGSVRYSYYSGYGDTFQYKGVFNQDQTPQEEEIVAIDALNFRDPHSALTLTDQYKTSCILRELQKAYVGFERPNMPDKPVATGNWGCGVFGGNFQIKSLIQWMAASEAGRTKLIYFAYGDADLADDLKDITSWLIGVDAKVGELYEAIGNYRVELRREKKSVSQYPLFKYVKTYFEILRGIVAPTQVVDLTDTQIEERDMREMIVDNAEKEQPIEEKPEQPVEEIKN
jgi:poly(ADP-ribose) glycohydrolase